MKKIALLALVSAFFACSPTDVPEGTSPSHDAAPAATNTATTTNTNTATSTGTTTTTATNTATNAAVNDAGAPATVTVTETKTVTQVVTVTETGTNTGIDGGVAVDSGSVKNDATPATSPDAAAPSTDAPASSPTCGPVEICGNGIDDDCDGTIDNKAQCGTTTKPDASPDTGSACSGTTTAPCTATIGGVLYTGTKQCVNGTFSSCLNLVLASTDAGLDKVQPVVLTPFCGLSDINNLPAGVAIPFYANASDNVGVVSCSFFVNNTLAPGTAVLEASGSWRLDIVLGAGMSAINVRCLDAAGNGGVPAEVLNVKTIGTDGGVSPDTLPAIDTLAPADTQVNADTQAPADTLPDIVFPDADLANGWPMIVCANANSSGSVVNIALQGNISGVDANGKSNLVDEMDSSWSNPTPAICLVGADGIGWNSRKYCADWTQGQTTVVFPPVTVTTSATTDVNYVIDNGKGRMIWGQNANLNIPGDTNRCGKGGSTGNLIIKQVSTW